MKIHFYGQYLYQDYTHENSFFMVSIYIRITHMKIHFYGQYLYQDYTHENSFLWSVFISGLHT